MTDDLSSLQQEIGKAKSSARPDAHPGASQEGLGSAMRLTLELVAGVAVGCLLGYAMDRWLGSSPWFLILFFFLGTAAGFRNMLREARKMTGEKSEKEG